MLVNFDRSFLKSLDTIKDKDLFLKIQEIIFELEQINSLQKIPSSKKLKGFKTFYRIRIGDYRLGFELENPETIRLIILAHRKEIYRYFP